MTDGTHARDTQEGESTNEGEGGESSGPQVTVSLNIFEILGLVLLVAVAATWYTGRLAFEGAAMILLLFIAFTLLAVE